MTTKTLPETLGVTKFNKGDRVRVLPEHRHRFHSDTAAARGEALTVTGHRGFAVCFGPHLSDYARNHELVKL